MTQCSCGKPLGKWNKSSVCWRCANAKRAMPIPDDFELYARADTDPKLAERYNVSIATICRWRVAVGVPNPYSCNRGRVAPNRRPAPQGFSAVASTMTTTALCTHYGCGRYTIARWCEETSVKPRTAVSGWKAVNAKRGLRSIETAGAPVRTTIAHNRNMSCAGQAADYLQPTYIPVHRADAAGKYDPRGTHWRCGRLVLTDGEIVELAQRKGWDPDAWKRLERAA